MTSCAQPLIVSVAPNGARKSKADHPCLPISDKELATTAADCQAAGATMIHLHVRDSVGRHTLSPEAYRSATTAIRQVVGKDLIIQVTSEAVGIYQREEQMAMIRALRPEAVSLALHEFIPNPTDESSAAVFFAWLNRERISPQYILYTSEEVRYFHDLRRRGLIPEGRPFVLFVLGGYNPGQQGTPEDLLAFLVAHEFECPWAVCAFGPQEAACTASAIARQGHARIGFENNLLLSDNSLAPDNAALVAQSVAAAQLLGRELADVDKARELLGCV